MPPSLLHILPSLFAALLLPCLLLTVQASADAATPTAKATTSVATEAPARTAQASCEPATPTTPSPTALSPSESDARPSGSFNGRVVCFGDSITKGGYPEELGRLLGAGIEVVNAGVGGNTSTAGLKRLQRDVIERKPGLVVVLFGTNDSRLDAPKVHVPPERFVRQLTEIIERCEAIGARVVLCTIPPIAPEPYFTRHPREPFDAAGGLPTVLENYRSAVRRLAAARGLALVDLGSRLAEHPGWLSADGVHPSPEGKKSIAQLVADVVAPLVGRTPPVGMTPPASGSPQETHATTGSASASPPSKSASTPSPRRP